MPSSNINRPGGNSEVKNFQPEQHIETRNGTSYMPLKWRLAWLRHDYPEASVETRLVRYEQGIIIFQAEIKLPGGGTASGWGARREDNADGNFNYLIEAENQALSRALAILGYGIEYAADFDSPSDGEAIPLRDSGHEDEEASIEVPMNLETEDVVGDEEAEEIGGIVRVTAAPIAARAPDPEPEPEEDEEEDEPEEKPAPPPTPIRSIAEEPARFNTEPVPLRPNRPAAVSSNPPTPIIPPNPPTPLPTRPAAVRRPGPTPLEPTAPAAPQPGPTPLTSSAVEERIKGINDSQLVLLIKQVFHEARRLHNLSEDAIDRNSVKRFGVPVNGLNLEQAEEYLERIKTAPRSPRK